MQHINSKQLVSSAELLKRKKGLFIVSDKETKLITQSGLQRESLYVQRESQRRSPPLFSESPPTRTPSTFLLPVESMLG